MAEKESSSVGDTISTPPEVPTYFRKTRRRLPDSLRMGIIAFVGALLAYGVFYGLREIGY